MTCSRHAYSQNDSLASRRSSSEVNNTADASRSTRYSAQGQYSHFLACLSGYWCLNQGSSIPWGNTTYGVEPVRSARQTAKLVYCQRPLTITMSKPTACSRNQGKRREEYPYFVDTGPSA